MEAINKEYHQKVIYRLFQNLTSKGKASKPADILDTTLAMFPEYKDFPQESILKDLNSLLLT